MNKAITMKKTIRDDDGRDLLRIASDTLPDAGHKAIEAFYAKNDRDFQQSCEKLLLPRAKRDVSDERFKTYGAVRRLTVACDTPELLSIVCDVSVYDGRRRSASRHSENWDRENGILLSFTDVFVKGAEKTLLALLREQAVEMQENGKRSHYSNYGTLLRRHFSKNAFFFHARGHRLLLSAEHTGHLRQAVRLPSAAQDASRTRIVEKYNLLSEKHLDSGGGTRIMKGKGSAPQRLRFCGGKG